MDTGQCNDPVADSGATGGSGDDPADYLSVNEAHELRNTTQEDGLLEVIEEATRESKEQRYTDPEDNYLRYQLKPLKEMLLYGGLAVAQLVGQLYLPALNAALDEPVEYVGWVRLCVFLGGCYCLLLAWPSRKHSDLDETERAERAAAKAKFHNKSDKW